MIWTTLKEPTDGWTMYEKQIMRDMIVSVYKQIPNPIDKFLIVTSIECGYTQTEISIMLGISQPAVSKRITRILKGVRKLNQKKKI